jgi:WD40 repeat protein
VRAYTSAAIGFVLLATLLPSKSRGEGSTPDNGVEPSVILSAAHHTAVTDVAFSPPGDLVLSINAVRGEPTVKLWDARTGRLLRNIGRPNVESAAFSPDGATIITDDLDGQVSIWDAATGKALNTFPASKQFRIEFAGDNTRAWIGGDLWNTLSGKVVRAADAWPVGLGTAPHTLVVQTDKAIQTLNVETGEIVSEEPRFPNQLKSLDGEHYINVLADKGLELIESRTGKRLATIRDSSTPNWSLDGFTPDGKRIVFRAEDANDNQLISFWNATTGECISQSTTNVGGYMLFSAASNYVLVKHFKASKVQVWDVNSGQSLGILDRGWPGTAAFSADGERFVVGRHSGSIEIYDTRTFRSLAKGGWDRPINGAVLFSPNGEQIAATSEDGIVSVWDAGKGVRLRTISAHPPGLVPSMMFVSNGKQLLTASLSEDLVKLWDLQSGELIKALGNIATISKELRVSETDDVYLSNDDGEVASVLGHQLLDDAWIVHAGQRKSKSGNVSEYRNKNYDANWNEEVIDAHTGEIIGHYRVNHTHNDRPILASNALGLGISSHYEADSKTDSVVFWHFPEAPERTKAPNREWWQEEQYLDAPVDLTIATDSRDFGSAALSRDGRIAAIADNGDYRTDGRALFKLLELPGGRQKCDYSATDGAPETLSFSADSSRIVTQGKSSEIRLWSTISCSLLATLISLPDRNWITLTPAGYLNSSDRKAEGVSIVRGLKTWSLDQIYEQLYRPDLVEESLHDDTSGKYKNGAAALNLGRVVASGPPPQLDLLSDQSVVAGDTVRLTVRLIDSGGGIGPLLKWRVNDQVQGDVDPRAISDRAKPHIGASIDVAETLAVDRSRVNTIRVTAYNGASLLASETRDFSVDADGVATVPRSKLYVLSIGADEYKMRDYRLTHAVNDAKTIASAFETVGRNLFLKPDIKSLLDKEANRDFIDAQFARIGSIAGPRDVFILYLAGHGQAVNGKYYFLPPSIDFAAHERVEDAGISQDQFLRWMALIKANKRLIIIDTCDSGSATSIVRGTETERSAAFARLEVATGDNLIAAANHTAYEGVHGHGILTYALLEGLNEQGNHNIGQVVTVDGLADFIDARVPELSEPVTGERQLPIRKLSGNNFPLGLRQRILVDDIEDLTEQTHVVIKSLRVRDRPKADARQGLALGPGARVHLMLLVGDWAKIARGGQELGFVPIRSLAQLQ